MAEENELETTVVVDGAGGADGAGDTAVQKGETVSAAEGVEELRRKLEMERTARAEAESRANSAERAVSAARGEAHDSNLAQVSSALTIVEQRGTQLEAQYAEAAADGDWQAAARLQTQMARNENQRAQLEQGKAALESRPATAPTVTPQIADPVERLASMLTPRSAAWVRLNPEYARDQKKYAQMVSAHNLVVARDFSPDSDEYFQEVEKILGISPNRQPPRVDTKAETNTDDPSSAAASATGGRGAVSTAAPGSRGSSGTQNSRVTRLTQAEMEAAKASGLTPEEYAKNREELRKAGRLN